MSGDVQPRKRKDKKRKKEESVEDVIHQIAQSTTSSPNDDVNIHIHKESSTGGGICAKFVFFILLAVLAVLIGLIITEHRGLTDLDAISTESRFSEIFEGWTDESSLHDDHDDELAHSKELGSHEDEDDDDHDNEDEDHEHDDDEQEEDDHETDDETRSTMSEEEGTDEETAEHSEEDEYIEETIEQSEDDDDDGDDDDDELGETAEHTEEEDEEEADEDDETEGETIEDTARSGEEESLGTTETYEESEEIVYNDDVEEPEDDDEEKDEDSGEDNVKDSDEDEEEKEESTKQTYDELVKEDDEENAEPVDENEEAAANIGVVKFGIGVSLMVVAYVVLVRKWRTDKVSSTPKDNEEIDGLPDLSRRNTIVVPPTLDQIQQELESEEDYTEEDEDDDDDDGIFNEEKLDRSSKRQYQELRNMYTRTLTPDEDDYDRSPVEDDYDDEQEDIEYEQEHERYDDDDEDEEDDKDIEDNEEDDRELLKRLEAKYGKIRHSDEEDDDKDNEDDEEDEEYDDYEKLKPWRRSDNNVAESDDENAKTGAQSYHFDNITNEDDWPIREELDNAQDYLPNSPADALSLFNKILELYPHSPRALYGKAKCLDLLADIKQSNKILQESIDYYLKVVTSPTSPEELFRIAAEKCIERMRFIGQYGRAIFVHKLLLQKYPDVSEYPNQLAVTYLTVNKIKEAKDLLYKTLLKWPNDGFALVHYGFILKTSDNNVKEAITYLKRGIDSKESGVIDGRFYFHLGDALTRLGRESEAYKVYEDGVSNNVFLSKYQRSLYNVNRLRGKPWWNEDDLPLYYQNFFTLLKDNWKYIRDEGLAALNRKNTFKNEAENLRDVGDWKQFELFARGVKSSPNCQKCPKTCKIMDAFPDASTCRRGQIKFSVMEPGTHVWPHCGPTNCRLRLHLGLKVPSHTYIRVADDIRKWNEGGIFIFDDSFEHEVWHNGTDFRLVLIVDMWHPDLTIREKSSLSAI